MGITRSRQRWAASNLGFSPKQINYIYGACKIYDTRVGVDPLFPDELLEDKDLRMLGEIGSEYGVTTGRRRKVNWLNLDKLIESINKSGTTHCIISKTDILEESKLFKLYSKTKLEEFRSLYEMKEYINNRIKGDCINIERIIYSNNVETLDEN